MLEFEIADDLEPVLRTVAFKNNVVTGNLKYILIHGGEYGNTFVKDGCVIAVLLTGKINEVSSNVGESVDKEDLQLIKHSQNFQYIFH